MARILNAGNIYSFYYKRYKHDPSPLALVLYCDATICHALNFHYLFTKNLNDDLIHMIAALATHNIRLYSMYSHYHNWMKKHIPGVIENAYRTYKPKHITEVKQITRGYWGITTFLNQVRAKNKHLALSSVQKRLSQKINAAKALKFKREAAAAEMNIDTISAAIEHYVNYMDSLISEARAEKEEMTDMTGVQHKLGRYLNVVKARRFDKEREAELTRKLNQSLNAPNLQHIDKHADLLDMLIGKARAIKK